MKTILFLISALLINSNILISQTKYDYPLAKKIDHLDTYFGTVVSDPYSWMEDMQSAELKEWVKEENKFTENYLSKIPFREKLKERITELWNYSRYSAPFRASDYYFFYKNDGLQNQSILYRQKGINGDAEVFLDPNKMSKDGTVAIGTTNVSWDNKYLGYIVNRAGSDWSEIYIMDIESKQRLKDSLTWVKFSGIDWHENGFYYNRYNEVTGDKFKEKNESPKIYFHKIGTAQSEDNLIFEEKEHPERFIGIFTTEDQTYLFKYIVEKGSNGNSLYFQDLKKGDFIYHPISESFEDQYFPVAVIDNQIYIKTNKYAPNDKLVKFDPSSNNFTDIIIESSDAMKGVGYINKKFIVEYLNDAHAKVNIYDKNGKFENEIQLPAIGSAYGFNGRKDDKEVFFIFTSFNFPPTIYKYDIEENSTSVFRRSEVKNFNSETFESKQVFYPSKDGTLIPMFLVYKEGLVLNGNNPTLLYGYGGFNVSETPNFSAIRLMFLENGGIYAVANLRGGGEYGEKWHQAGMQLNKQNVFDDFISAGEYLIKEKYTSSGKLAIQGGSNGGLLVGAVINQRPELFKVALPSVGVMDMLKYHKFTIGWAWVTDYGSSDDSVHFMNLYSFSPLHNIRKQNYPATFITTSDHDDRVVPLHSYKYAATLQANNSSDNPVLLSVETDAGHGSGTPTAKAIEQQTNLWSFVFYNLGMFPN